MRVTRDKEIKSVLNLDGPARFKHFIKRVADEERAWGLWSNGWALVEDGGGKLLFPIWPAKEYAELCQSGEWRVYVPTEIGLNSLVNDILPKLKSEGVDIAVFLTPASKGVTVSVAELMHYINEEMARY